MSAARDKVIGSTIRNTAEMRPMGTGKPRISTAVQLAGRVVRGELALGPVLAELELDPAAAPELETAPVAEQELEIDLVAEEEREIVPVAVEPELGRVVAVLEHVLAAAVPERDPVAVLLRTRSVIAAHHRDRVLARRVEDSAVAAETTREPAVTEAAVAWAAAVIAVVAVVVVVAAE